MGQGIAAEDAVQRVEESSPQAQQNTSQGDGQAAGENATPRTALHRFTFPKGRSHVLMNLGEALSNETGGMLRRVSDNEVEGVRLLGTFCYYNQQGVFPLYFVMRVEKQGMQQGYWKFQRPMVGDEADWDPTQGTRKVYKEYAKEIAGDDVGAWFSFNTEEGEQVEVRIGVSFVSTENARMNLEAEQKGKHFDQIRREARQQWNDVLSRIEVEGGTEGLSLGSRLPCLA